MSGLPHVWGATDTEVATTWACDRLHPDATVRLVRAVDVDACAETVFAWLGNLRVAPYSYDLLDNRGRRSPRRLRTDLPPLAAGQRAVAIFDVLDVVEGEELTLATRGDAAERVFGPVTLTYAVRPGRVRDPGGSRLVAVVRQGHAHGRLERARSLALAWGDLLMMRKQLLTLRDLAEQGPVAPGPR